MKAAIITCFQSNEERVQLIKEAFKQKKYVVRCFTTNFLHKTKEFRTSLPVGFEAINTIKYKKNISFARLWSHYRFAKDAFAQLEKDNPEIIWIEAPCNSLIKSAYQYKKKHKNVKIIIDMIDMWPESLPIYNKISFLLQFWKRIRSKYLKYADVLVSECDLYRKKLSKEFSNNIETLYWAKDRLKNNIELNIPNDKLALCYIGSINNIIDIDLICNLIQNTDSKCELHVIGTGEKKKELIDKAEKICNVFDYGENYDSAFILNVMNKCHAGLNVYKKDLYIGLTVKSLDYLRHGLPLINSIKGDTWKLVDDENVGININQNSKIGLNNISEQRNNYLHICNVFNEKFSNDVFVNKCLDIISGVEK